MFSINRGGHVVYGYVPEGGRDSMELFDPQINKAINWGHLGPNPIARRYTARG